MSQAKTPEGAYDESQKLCSDMFQKMCHNASVVQESVMDYFTCMMNNLSSCCSSNEKNSSTNTKQKKS